MTSRIRAGDDDLRVIGVRDIGAVLSPPDALEIGRGLNAEDARGQMVAAGDIILSSRGAVRSAVVEEGHKGAVAGVNTVVVRPWSKSAAPVLTAYLRHPRTVAALLAGFSGSTVPGFSLDTLRALPLDLPDDETVAGMSRMIAAAYRYHDAMLEAAQARLTLALDLVVQNLTPLDDPA
ncbi:hypothetical protein ACIQC9_06540 [Brevundimonas sp. NPDC092305]|uniref:hypothetical protein n=1 Tax=Brevundimonas sp. NPDC092305 TaxID=3363957 RepID=UPI0037FCDE3F